MERFEVTAALEDGEEKYKWSGEAVDSLEDAKMNHISRTIQRIARRFPVTVTVFITDRSKVGCDDEEAIKYHVETVEWCKWVHAQDTGYFIIIDCREINGQTWCEMWKQKNS